MFLSKCIGNLVKCCEPTAFFPPFVTYVREDDTYNSLLNRLIEISGDSSLAFCRLSVVERSFVPTFIPRTSGNGSVHRSLSTTLSSAESIQSLESCSTPIVASNTTTTFSDHEDGDEEDTENEMTSPLPSNVKISTPNTGGVNPAGPTVWSYFAEKYPQHAQHDIFTAFEMNRRINPRNTSSVFAHAWLGVQRATADLQLATQLKR